MNGGLAVYLHAFLTSVLDGDEWSQQSSNSQLAFASTVILGPRRDPLQYFCSLQDIFVF
jgi:hypothetical protein